MQDLRAFWLQRAFVQKRGKEGKNKRKKKRKEAWCITLTAPLLAAHAS